MERIRGYIRRHLPAAGSLLTAAIVVVALALIAGCTGQRQFSPMPRPAAGFATILGPVAGSGSATFKVSARPGIAIWLGCIGKGMVRMTRPYGVAATCRGGNVFVGGQTQPTHFRRGQKLVVRIAGPATIRWEFRIDGRPWPR